MSNQPKGGSAAAINAAAEAIDIAAETPKATKAAAATPAAEPSLGERVMALAKACIGPAIAGAVVAGGAYMVGVRKGVAIERNRAAQAAASEAAEAAEAAEVMV